MKERPILFSPEMVRAILEGRKTQTRRVVKHQLSYGKDEFFAWFGGELRNAPNGCAPDGLWSRGLSGIQHVAASPYGVPGDRLWVKEALQWKYTRLDEHCIESGHVYASTPPDDWVVEYVDQKPLPKRNIPSIQMPRWASRLTLEVTDVRVQRLQDISEEDAKAEGSQPIRKPAMEALADAIGADWAAMPYASGFATLWESINGVGSWSANPWVWVVTFKVVKP